MTEFLIGPNDDLQAAINAAQSGDVITVQAGTSHTGNFILPAKSNADYITIQSSRASELPAKVTPADAGLMAKLQSANVDPVIATTPNAHHYQLIGLELTSTADGVYNIVRLGEFNETILANVPHHLTIDRCYVHGQPTLNSQRGVLLNSAETTITNCYISDIHWVGVETQALAGWNGPGPFTITNNYLEAAGINVLFGGVTPAIPNLVPSDITISNNTMFKPLTWRVGDPSYAGIHWSVKNLLELKSARRVTIMNNVMENSWPDTQIGWAVIFNAFKDGGWEVVEDVAMSRNTFKNTTHGIDLRGRDDPDTVVRMKRITIEDNYLQNLGAYGVNPTAFLLLNASEDVTINHNTVEGVVNQALGFSGGSQGHLRFKFTNNLLPFGNYGVFGDGGTLGTAALNQYASAWTFLKNALYEIKDQVPSQYPADNYFPINASDAAGLLGTDGLPVGARGTAPVPPDPPPVTGQAPTITAPTTVTVVKNGMVDISVTLSNLTAPVTVIVGGSDGQVTVSPLSRIATPTSAVLAFRIKVKKQSRTITFNSAIGSVSTKINVV